jgi:H+/Cl- antiporter ClcA
VRSSASPIAGCVFGLEVQSVGRIRYDALVPALTASLVGDLVVHGVGIHHTPTPALGPLHVTVALALKVALAGVAFGLTARAFTELVHRVPVGFVAVFAGAANVPLACTVMGAELFGSAGFVLYGVGCVVAYAFSSHHGIYSSQRLAIPKGAAGSAMSGD